MILLKISHIRKAGYCVRGARAWALRHNIDFSYFLQNGMPVEVFEAIGDSFAMHACRVAREEAALQEKEASNGQEQ